MKRGYCVDSGRIELDAERTPDGYVTGRAFVKRTGVFDYMRPDGVVVPVLHHPDDVYAAICIDSLKMLAFQVLHREMLDVTNMDRLKVGHAGSDVRIEPPFVSVDFVIDCKPGIDAIEAGLNELSCGYWRDLEEVADDGLNIYDGKRYLYRQRNIENNHVALCEAARLGPELRIDLGDSAGADSARHDVWRVALDSETSNSTENSMKVKLKNGLEYDAAPEVNVELHALNTEIAAAKVKAGEDAATITRLTSERDAQIELVTTANAALKTEKDGMPAKIKAAAAARAALEAIAKDCLDAADLETLTTALDSDLKKKIIGKAFPKTSLDGKDDTFIETMFEAAKSQLDSGDSAAALAEADGGTTPRTSAAASGDAKKNLTSLYLKDKGKSA